MPDEKGEQMSETQPLAVKDKYELWVCAMCGSDRIVSTKEDSWCEECKEWMNAEVITVSRSKTESG